MKKILGLDVSSATIGWALLSSDRKLIQYGHLRPPSKKQSKDNFSLRLNFAFEELGKLLKELEPDVIAIEDYAKRFTKGRSSANTILVLSCFNEVCGLVAYQKTGDKPTRISVATLRALVNKGYEQDLDGKPAVLKFCQEQFDIFSPVFKRTGKIKDESYDEADAIIVALGYILEHKL